MKWSRVEHLLIAAWGLVISLLILARPFASWAIVVVGVLVLSTLFVSDKPKVKWNKWNLLLLLPIALFLVYALGFMRFFDHPDAWPRFERKASLLVIPVLWVFSRLRWDTVSRHLYRWLIGSILIGGLIMLMESASQFLSIGEINSFFYQSLTPPIGISPIYFSWFIVMGLAWPNAYKDLFLASKFNWLITGILLILLILSASKLFTFIGLVIIFIDWWKHQSHRSIHWKQAALGILLCLLAIPLAQRVKPILDTDFDIVWQDQYQYDSPFNGLTLRLVQLRLGAEILMENDAWLMGVGPARSKELLDDQYRKHNIYTGNPELGDRGMLAYNYHNQWMETLTATGILGAFLLLGIFIGLLTRPNHGLLVSSIIYTCLLFTFTESYLEREQGIVFFVLLISIIFKPGPID